jgi:uncharacterized membrane protein (DUF2068 family)
MSDEPTHMPMTEEKPKKAPALYFIVGIKALKGIAALLLAWASYSLSDNNLPDEFRRLLGFFHIDPEKRFFQAIAERLNDVTAANMNTLAVISVIYGLFMMLQAVGLAMRVSWVVWLVIGESAFFIPIEIRELISKRVPTTESHLPILGHPKIGVAIILIINIAIVWYLFKNRNRIIRHHHH